MKKKTAKFMHAGKAMYGTFMGNRGPKVTLLVDQNGRQLEMDVPRSSVLEWDVSEPRKQERRHKGGKGTLMRIGMPFHATPDKAYKGWTDRLTPQQLEAINAKRTGVMWKAHVAFGGWNNPAMRPELPDNGCEIQEAANRFLREK